ncbi:hypothetical protein VST7929_02488 [Vibrio stylophorae]|uniref:Lipoprotein n=1 Tax=Vibrio stylophorae TaxID=659351 RepID=A0ABM8ZW39_9VIBR|nr:hypothetical protein [Vibrio stylophorae]CAH0534544.1 hypothetical protein VST7929_02488 [Vibrio stylophorae]
MRIISRILLFSISILIAGCWQNQALQTWQVAPEGASSVALSRDGRFALLYSSQQQLVLWDLVENKIAAELGAQDQNKSRVIQIDISDNLRYAITASQDNFAIWDLAWGTATGLWSISDGAIRAVDLSSDGQQVLLGLTNGKAIYVNLDTGRRMEFLAHREIVNSVALSANGRYALSGGDDGMAYFWDTETGQAIYQFKHDTRVNRVALQRDGLYAFTADSGKGATIWSLKTGKAYSQLKSRLRQLVFASARFSDDGDYLVTGAQSRRVSLWQTKTGERLAQWEATAQKDTRPPSAVVYDVAITPQGDVISASSAGFIEAWKSDDLNHE